MLEEQALLERLYAVLLAMDEADQVRYAMLCSGGAMRVFGRYGWL